MDHINLLKLDYSNLIILRPTMTNKSNFDKVLGIYNLIQSQGLTPLWGDDILFPNNVTPSFMPLLDNLDFNLSFDELVDDRAITLIKTAITHDKDIVIKYSGGIDSTVVLCAILKWIPAHYKDRLYVALTNNSIIESLDFYLSHVQYLNLIPLFNTLDRALMHNSMILTGTLLDSIIGFYSYTNDDYKLPYKNNKDVIKKLLSTFSIFPESCKYKDWAIDYIEQTMVPKSPIPIDTIYEFIWCLHYNGNYIDGTLEEFEANYIFRQQLFNNTSSKADVDTLCSEQSFSFYSDRRFDKWTFHNMKSDQIINKGNNKYMSTQYISDFINSAYTGIKLYSGDEYTKFKKQSTIALTSEYETMTYNDSAFVEMIIDQIDNLNL